MFVVQEEESVLFNKLHLLGWFFHAHKNTTTPLDSVYAAALF